MGLFSTKKSTAVSSNTTTSQGQSDIGGDALNLSGTGNTVTDGGAIAGSLGLAESAIQTAAELTLGLVSAQAESGRAALESARQSAEAGYKFAMDAGRSDVSTMNQAIKAALILGGIFAAAFVLKGWAK